MVHTIITDIEGTTTPISFVHEVLFPFARENMSKFLAERAEDEEVRAIVAEVGAMEPGAVIETLLRWMDADLKVTPLKTLQGLIWREGYRTGALKSILYPDVAPNLRYWSDARLRLYVYSSGSVEAQRQLFSHTIDGDISGLFASYFDTNIGPKREPESYRRILSEIDTEADKVLFLSDVEAELDAAAAAGLVTCQIVRPEDGTVASSKHITVDSFEKITW